jgi:glycosyltransferase involved in cell wall biosynthesis
MRVSVITPVYNGAEFLAQAIDSLLAQTMKDWELVIVDDGSTDATPEVIDGYDDPRIFRIRQPNSGEAVARNTGLRLASGEYVGWLDADDLYLPNALTDLSEFLDARRDVDVVYSDGYLCDEHGKLLTRLSDHRTGVHVGNVLEQLVLSSEITAPVCALMRRSAVRRYGITFDPDLVIGPDWDFWIQLAACDASFGYMDKLTCLYRVHTRNITRLSGQEKRRRDLVSGRMKVLRSAWFDALSTATRRKFFYHLAVELLAGQPDRQREILRHHRFGQLPVAIQAALWRHVAVDYLRRGADPDFAAECLGASQSLGGDLRTLLLTKTVQYRVGRSISRRVLRAWRAGRSAFQLMRHPGRHRPKPVPAALGPIGA